jgi:dTDP-glucose 4,6-dehydratase
LDDLPLPLYGDGKNVRDWIYVLDNCEAIDVVLHKGEPGEIYNIGAGNEIPNIEITEMILKKLNKPKTLIKPVPDRPGHDRRYSLDCEKILKLGWKPKCNFEEALDNTIKWYRDNEQWWRNIKEKQVSFQKYYQKQYSSLK